MYIIEYKDSWVKKEGKLSFCKVFKNEDAGEEVSLLMEQYIQDLISLIELDLCSLEQKFNIPKKEIEKLRELISELQNANVTNVEKK